MSLTLGIFVGVPVAVDSATQKVYWTNYEGKSIYRNDALGGNIYAVAKLEAEFPLGLPEEYGIRGGLFYDVGSVWDLDVTNANTIYDDFSLRHVVGVSIFWDSVVGPLRFNFSKALQKEDFDDEQTFNLTISTRF